MENPWNIQSIYDLQYFNCPVCIFKNPSKQDIINHAYDYHPESIEHLMNINDNSLMDISLPWDIIVKKETETDVQQNENFGEYPLNIECLPDIKSGNDYVEYVKKEKTETFDENVLVPDTILEYDNTKTINEQSNFGIKVEVSDENGYKTNYGNVHVKTVQKRQRKRKYNIEAVTKLVEGSGIEDIKNAQLKGEMWENIAKDYQKITGKVTTGHAIRIKWSNFKYASAKKSNLNAELIKVDHEGQKDYKCEICGKCFRQLVNLNQHISKMHGGTSIKSMEERETLIKLVEESGIEDIKNTKLKSEIWKNIANEFQIKTGNVTSGKAIRVKWNNLKYKDTTKRQSNLENANSEASDHAQNCQYCGTYFADKSEIINHIAEGCSYFQ